MKSIRNTLQSLRKEISQDKMVYVILAATLFLGFFFRVYRINDILNFYYDQGRDALVIWDLWHRGNFFLIGPTTGLAGIFRGPYYYYLIAPFYLFGRGDPVWPSVFLSFLTIIAVAMLYHLGMKIGGRVTGLFAAIIGSLSFYIVTASRWLSNPTPMLLLSTILIWAMLKVTEGKKWGWVVISFVAGMALFNFGSSGELYYLPAIAIFGIWQWKNRPNLKYAILSILAFTISFAPLVLFDLRNQGILRNNIFNSFVEEKSFTMVTKYLFENRTKFYYDVFTNKIFHQRQFKEIIALSITGLVFLFSLPKLIKNNGVRILLIVFLSPLAGLYFYQGNYTVLYDYYMTGYYLVFILLFAISLGVAWKTTLGKVFVIIFFAMFLHNNLEILIGRLNDRVDGPETIYIANQKAAIDWIYQDAAGREFNVDVYVPPVIPYAYDYLFKWYGGQVHGREPKTELTTLLYTLHEVDPSHPDRINAWLDRQKGIGRIEESAKFGGITVDRRTRLK